METSRPQGRGTPKTTTHPAGSRQTRYDRPKRPEPHGPERRAEAAARARKNRIRPDVPPSPEELWRQRRSQPPLPGPYPQLRPPPQSEIRGDAAPERPAQPPSLGLIKLIRESWARAAGRVPVKTAPDIPSRPCPICRRRLGDARPLRFDHQSRAFAHSACLNGPSGR